MIFKLIPYLNTHDGSPHNMLFFKFGTKYSTKISPNFGAQPANSNNFSTFSKGQSPKACT